jgi:hypothetical protein
MAYVAYTELGEDVPPGTVVKEADFEPDQWEYLLEHGNVVTQGGEHDPRILEARAAGEDYEDPRDARIAELEAQLAQARGGGPVDLNAQAKVDDQQAKK